MSGTILRRRDRTARPPRVEHYSSAVNIALREESLGSALTRVREVLEDDDRHLAANPGRATQG